MENSDKKRKVFFWIGLTAISLFYGLYYVCFLYDASLEMPQLGGSGYVGRFQHSTFVPCRGRLEILARRVDRNEWNAIEVCRGYVEAQLEMPR